MVFSRMKPVPMLAKADFMGILDDFMGILHDVMGILHDFMGILDDFMGSEKKAKLV